MFAKEEDENATKVFQHLHLSCKEEEQKTAISGKSE